MKMVLLQFQMIQRSTPVPNIGLISFVQRTLRVEFRSILALGFLAMSNLWTCSAHAAGQTSAPDERATIISFIQKKNSEIGSYSVEARAFSNNMLDSKDKIYFKRPSYVRWEEYHPGLQALRSILIANGQDCFLYDPDAKTLKKWPCQWQKSSLRAVLPFLDFMSIGDDVKLVKDTQGKKNSAYVIEVTDKKGSSNRNLWTISRGYFDRKSGLLIKLILLGGYGDIRSETVFENYKLNIPLEDSFFFFSPPAGTQIIEEE